MTTMGFSGDMPVVSRCEYATRYGSVRREGSNEVKTTALCLGAGCHFFKVRLLNGAKNNISWFKRAPGMCPGLCFYMGIRPDSLPHRKESQSAHARVAIDDRVRRVITSHVWRD